MTGGGFWCTKCKSVQLFIPADGSAHISNNTINCFKRGYPEEWAQLVSVYCPGAGAGAEPTPISIKRRAVNSGGSGSEKRRKMNVS